MEADRLRKDEYEMQHFGFSSTQFINDFNKHIDDGLKTVLEQTKNELLVKANQNGSDEIDKEFNSIYELFKAEANHRVTKFEEHVRKFLEVPTYVLPALFNLPEIVSLPNDSDTEELQKEIRELEKTYLKEKAFQKFCELKLEHLKALEPVVSVVRESIQKYNSLVTIKDDEKLAKLSDIHLKCVEALAPETCGESIIHYNR